MNCPNCGAPNAPSHRFCEKCGTKLPVVFSTEPTTKPAFIKMPQHPVARAALKGSVTGILSGGLIVFGYLIPWVSFSGILRNVLNFLDLGLGGELFNFGGMGIGSGLQLTLLAFASCLLGFTDTDIIWMCLPGLVIGVLLLMIPIIGISNIRAGIKLFEDHLASDEELTQREYYILDPLHTIKRRSSRLFVGMVIVFVIASALPFGTSIIGKGFFVCILGTVVGYLGVMIAQARRQ